MSTVVMRGKKYEFIIKRKNILIKPYTIRFDDKDEGQAWCDHLESLLDAGIVPEFLQKHIGRHTQSPIQTLRDLIVEYKIKVHIKDEDVDLLNRASSRSGDLSLSDINYNWAENWVAELKRIYNLAPSTVRKYVGAVARCLDWAIRKDLIRVNPLRVLPKGYSRYTEQDKKESGGIKVDVERNRRLGEDEEKAVYKVFSGCKPQDRERPLQLKYKAALICIFELAINSAMRLSEMYTISLHQVDLNKKTIYLEKTKNGDKRQVPLTSDAITSVNTYLYQVSQSDKSMRGFNHEGGLLFPWWDGQQTKQSLKKTTAKLSKQFKSIFDHAGLHDFLFHDLRHEATCRFYQRTKLSDVQISNITGHRDPKMLKRYANLRGSELAAELW